MEWVRTHPSFQPDSKTIQVLKSPSGLSNAPEIQLTELFSGCSYPCWYMPDMVKKCFETAIPLSTPLLFPGSVSTAGSTLT